MRVWTRYLPDPEDEEQYEKFCYAKMILHHPFSKTEGNTSWQEALKGECSTWKAAYRELCLDDPSHSHPPDSLPNTIEVPRDIESSSGEDVEPEEEPLRFRPAWMQVAGEQPNQQFSADISNLGRREQDNADWVLNSPGQEICNKASRWLSDQKKDSPNDDAQDLPGNVNWRTLKGNQQLVFLQVMAYMKYIHDHPSGAAPEPLRINVDGTAGTGKSWLIWSITQAIRELFDDQQKELVACLAPTGIAAYGIHGWTLNFGLTIPVKEPRSGMYSLNSAALKRAQFRWKDIKLVIMDEKSMIGRAQFGRVDRRLRQILSNPTETFGNIPIIMFGDFAQLPPVGDSPLYSTSETRSAGLRSLRMEGLNAYRSFDKSITLTTVHRQAGTDQEQVRFREALKRLRTYNINQTDYELFSSRFWDQLSEDEIKRFEGVLHLMPTKDSVEQYNHMRLAKCGEPVLILPAKHNPEISKKASDEEAEGLHAKVLISVGASVMLTRNIWTSKGTSYKDSIN